MRISNNPYDRCGKVETVIHCSSTEQYSTFQKRAGIKTKKTLDSKQCPQKMSVRLVEVK